MKELLQGKAVCDVHGEYDWRFIPGPQKSGDYLFVSGERYVNMPDGMSYNEYDHKWRGTAVCPKCGKQQKIEIMDDMV